MNPIGYYKVGQINEYENHNKKINQIWGRVQGTPSVLGGVHCFFVLLCMCMYMCLNICSVILFDSL